MGMPPEVRNAIYGAGLEPGEVTRGVRRDLATDISSGKVTTAGAANRLRSAATVAAQTGRTRVGNFGEMKGTLFTGSKP